MSSEPSGSEPSSKKASSTHLDIERSLLGGCLNGGRRSVDEAVIAGLRGQDFARKEHRSIWEAMASLHEKDDAVDVVTVCDELDRGKKLDTVGGAAAVSQLGAMMPTAAHVRTYSSLIVEGANMRRIAEAAVMVQQMAAGHEGTAAEVLADAQATFLSLNRRAADDLGVVDRRATVERVVDGAMRKTTVGTLPTGYPDLDHMLRGGWRNGNLYVIAARPGMGKSAFGHQACTFLADEGIPTALMSLEMTGDELIEREIAGKARLAVEVWSRRDGAAKVADAAADVAERPLYLIDRAGLDINAVCSRARRLVARDGVQLVVVDYVGLVSGTGKYRGDRTNEVGEITKALKELAQNLNVPVLALSQLNRDVEKRTDKRPLLADLRDSGSVEQDANAVIFLYREEYYAKDKTPEHLRRVCEVIVAKNRNGATGHVELLYDGPTTRFFSKAKNA